MVNITKTKNFKNLKTVVLAVNIMAIFVLFYWIIGLKNTIVSQSQELAKLQNDYNLLNKLNDDYGSNKNKIESITKSLPLSYLDIGMLAYKIENAAKLEGMESELSFEKEAVTENGYVSLNVISKTTGGYQDYSRFLSNVAGLPYNIEVADISYEKEKNEISQKTTFKIYLRK